MKKILIIEDDQAILKLLQRGLAYEGQGNMDQAISDWQTALQLHPNWDPATGKMSSW